MASTGHLGMHSPQSSQPKGSMAKSPRNESVFVSAPVGQANSHPPQPMHASSMTFKLMLS